jgi:hypothetical protein
MPQVHQHVLHLSNSITYILEQRNATSPSATCPAPVKQHHLHAEGRGMPQVHQQHLAPVKQHHLHTEGRGMPQVHQQHVLHMSNSITYSLRAEECHKCHQQHVLHLSNSITYSLRDRGMPQVHQQHVLHLSNSITYSLRAEECHKSISNMSCTCQTASLTL